jgi:hypothetical protein
MALTPAELIEKYLHFRNHITTLKEKHDKELAPYKTVMSEIENVLLGYLNETQLDSLKAPQGTAYKQTVTSVTVDNWREALDYIKSNQVWDLLEARVAKNATLDRIEDTGHPVPGVKISQAIVLRVRTSQG